MYFGNRKLKEKEKAFKKIKLKCARYCSFCLHVEHSKNCFFFFLYIAFSFLRKKKGNSFPVQLAKIQVQLQSNYSISSLWQTLSNSKSLSINQTIFNQFIITTSTVARCLAGRYNHSLQETAEVISHSCHLHNPQTRHQVTFSRLDDYDISSI